jgi:SAM-dependent methyltransferase
MAGRIPHDDWAQWYDAIYDLTFGSTYRWLTDETLRAVQTMAKPGDTILDVGAATGRLAIPLAAAGHRVLAVDRSPAMLHRLLMRAATLRVGHRVSAQCASAHEVECENAFDIALCVFTVLLYVSNRTELDGTLRAISRALRIGGRLLLDVPRRDLFVGYHADTDKISRHVRITADPSDPHGRRFSYHDEVYLRAPFFVHVAERFDATWWPEAEVLEAANDAGLVLEIDLSKTFAAAASTHWWLRRVS